MIEPYHCGKVMILQERSLLFGEGYDSDNPTYSEPEWRCQVCGIFQTEQELISTTKRVTKTSLKSLEEGKR